MFKINTKIVIAIRNHTINIELQINHFLYVFFFTKKNTTDIFISSLWNVFFCIYLVIGQTNALNQYQCFTPSILALSLPIFKKN